MTIAWEAQGTNATGGAPGTATLPVAASLVTSAYGVVAEVARRTNTAAGAGGVDPAPDHAALDALGWDLIGWAANATGLFRTGVYFYGRRGDGSFNSISVPNNAGAAATTNETFVRIVAVPNVKEAQFWVTPDLATQFRSTTNLAQLSPGPVVSSEADSTLLAFAATGTTAGGTAGSPTEGFSWTPAGLDATATGGSLSSRVSAANMDVPASGTSVSATVSWNTAGTGAAGIVMLKTRLVTAAPSGTGTRSTLQMWSAAGMANAVSMTYEQTSGPDVDVVLDGLDASFVDLEGRTADVVIAFTVSNGAGSTTLRTITFPPGSGTIVETIVRAGSTIVRRADGLLH